MKKVITMVLSLAVMVSILSFAGTNQASASTQAIPLKGAYSYAHYLASGGRVDIEISHLYLSPSDARAYATKSEQSLWEGIAWFGASFIPVAGPYLATLGLLQSVQDSTFVSDIRKYADKEQCVDITISKDNWYGVTYRTATYWDGTVEDTGIDRTLNQDYLVDSYITYKYY